MGREDSLVLDNIICILSEMIFKEIRLERQGKMDERKNNSEKEDESIYICSCKH